MILLLYLPIFKIMKWLIGTLRKWPIKTITLVSLLLCYLFTYLFIHFGIIIYSWIKIHFIYFNSFLLLSLLMLRVFHLRQGWLLSPFGLHLRVLYNFSVFWYDKLSVILIFFSPYLEPLVISMRNVVPFGVTWFSRT